MVGRGSARGAILIAASFGWVLVAGVVVTALLAGGAWSNLPFGIAVAISLLLVAAAHRVQAVSVDSEEDARTVPWLSGLARELRVSKPYLTVLAKSAMWKPRAVLAAVWVPLWLLLAFVVFLWAQAAVQFVG